MKIAIFFVIVIGNLFLFGCSDSLYLKIKGPVSECVKINTGWECSMESGQEFSVLDVYSLMKLKGENTNVIISGFYSEVTSPAFLPEQIQFCFNNKKYYLCENRGLFSTGKEIFIIDEFGEKKVIFTVPRSIADACVLEFNVGHNRRFLVVFAMLTPKSHNCELWILDENFVVVYDEILSNMWHPQITLYNQGAFSVNSQYYCYNKSSFQSGNGAADDERGLRRGNWVPCDHRIYLWRER